jgi:hypothetical protein
MGWRSSTVEQLICNQQVVGSNPIASSTYSIEEGWCGEEFVSGWSRGEVPEWPKGADCKSAGDAFEGSNPSLSTNFAGIAQLVERKPSKLGVAGSSPVSRSTLVVAMANFFTSRFHAPKVGTARPNRHRMTCPGSSVGRARPW